MSVCLSAVCLSAVCLSSWCLSACCKVITGCSPLSRLLSSVVAGRAGGGTFPHFCPRGPLMCFNTSVRFYNSNCNCRPTITGVDLSKILKKQTQILGGNVVKKCMSVSQFGGASGLLYSPKVYASAYYCA